MNVSSYKVFNINITVLTTSRYVEVQKSLCQNKYIHHLILLSTYLLHTRVSYAEHLEYSSAFLCTIFGTRAKGNK